jgi:hypothetical protein
VINKRKKNASEFLINNPSQRLTDYADLVETLRFTGSHNLEAIEEIAQMPHTLELNEKFFYYLQLQYISLNAKSIYYKTRSSTLCEIVEETIELLTDLLKTISSYFLLEHLLSVKSDSPLYYGTLRSLENQIQHYCNKTIDRDPFKKTSVIFMPKLQNLLKQSKAIVKNVSLEVCTICFNSINEDQLECSQHHNLNRCLITNLLIPLECENYCGQCKTSVTWKKNFIELFHSETSKFFFCPFCDSKFIFHD